MFQIEKNIPIPTGSLKGGVGKYPWYVMEVGDSFFVPRTQLTVETYRPSPPPQVNIKIKTRKCCEDGIWGVRIWRIV